MKRIKKLFAVIAIAFLLVPVSVMVLQTNDNIANAACWECSYTYGCIYGAANGWDACDDYYYNCWYLDGADVVFSNKVK